MERITPATFPEFVYLIEELARFEKLDPPDAAGVERLRGHAFQARPFYEAYLARYDGLAVGYIIFFYSYSSFKAKPTLFLEDLFVLESHRGKGIGKSLFLFAVDQAHKNDCGRMEWSALNWNKNAIDFYISMGARPLDEWTFYRMTEEGIEALIKKK
jgi:GNAT superfamily N-acetyltransferase